MSDVLTETEVKAFVDKLAEFRTGLSDPEADLLDQVVGAALGRLGHDVEGFTLIELSPRSATVETVELLLFGRFAVDIKRVGTCTKNGAD